MKPLSFIEIKNGLVVKVKEGMLLNLVPSETLTLERRGEQFYGQMNDEEHGHCPNTEGTLDSVLSVVIHPNFHQRYRNIFALKEATEATVKAIIPRNMRSDYKVVIT